MESLRTHDSSLLISSKIDSLLDEFVGELTLLKSIPPGIDETDCDFEEDIRLIEKLLYNNSSPCPLEEFVSANSDAAIKSFSPSPILVKDKIIPTKIDPHSFNAESDLIESMPHHDSSIIISSKIDSLFDEFAGKHTLLKSIPPRIDEIDCHPEEETHFTKRLLYDNSSSRPLEEFVFENSNTDIESFSPSPILIKDKLLNNYSLSLPKNESCHFDIPSPYRPPAKSPDGNTGILNIKMMGDISGQKVPIPSLMITHVLSQEKSPDLLPHQGLKAFQSFAEYPMMINGKNTPILDVPLFHF
nr:hypothetical protein [Tanacetum cinerariifolium]